MHPVVRQLLDHHRAERDKILIRAQALVEQDDRVCAAWLFGSLGRGDADELSDIDLFVIVHDEHYKGGYIPAQFPAQAHHYLNLSLPDSLSCQVCGS